MGCKVWLATKPPTGVPFAYADKVSWVLKHLPELKHRIILTPDKGLFGDRGDYLIDDRPHLANCPNFSGTLIAFTDRSAVLNRLRRTPRACA
jgi:5'(3')-deoxyribonucleotidase